MQRPELSPQLTVRQSQHVVVRVLRLHVQQDCPPHVGAFPRQCVVPERHHVGGARQQLQPLGRPARLQHWLGPHP